MKLILFHVLILLLLIHLNVLVSENISENISWEKYADPLCLTNIGQIVRIVPPSLVAAQQTDSNDDEANSDRKNKSSSNYLEVVDISRNTVRYLPLPNDTKSYPMTKWSPKQVLIDALSNDVTVTVSLDGSVRLWETGASDLQKSFAQWKTLVGDGNQSESLQVTACYYSYSFRF